MLSHIDGIETRAGGGGVPRVRAFAGVLNANPDGVARAIDDLGRSGYRPLRPSPMAPDPASMRHAWDGGADRDAGGRSPVKADES